MDAVAQRQCGIAIEGEVTIRDIHRKGAGSVVELAMAQRVRLMVGTKEQVFAKPLLPRSLETQAAGEIAIVLAEAVAEEALATGEADIENGRLERHAATMVSRLPGHHRAAIGGSKLADRLGTLIEIQHDKRRIVQLERRVRRRQEVGVVDAVVGMLGEVFEILVRCRIARNEHVRPVFLKKLPTQRRLSLAVVELPHAQQNDVRAALPEHIERPPPQGRKAVRQQTATEHEIRRIDMIQQPRAVPWLGLRPVPPVPRLIRQQVDRPGPRRLRDNIASAQLEERVANIGGPRAGRDDDRPPAMCN